MPPAAVMASIAAPGTDALPSDVGRHAGHEVAIERVLTDLLSCCWYECAGDMRTPQRIDAARDG